MRPSVALVSGFWGQNIGNAFFNIGGKWILDQIFGEGCVDFIQDQPGYWTFNNQSRGNPKKDINLLKYLDVDYVVLQGPIMTVNFRSLWEGTFREYKRRGIKVILLSAAFFKFTKVEIKKAKSFLLEYPPVIISTRDHKSYDIIKKCAEYTYSGIDSAFYVPEAYKPFSLCLNPYIVLNFDRYPEPNIFVTDAESFGRGATDISFEALGYCWHLRIPEFQNMISGLGKWQAYIGCLLDKRKMPTMIKDYGIVRTEHRVNPHIAWKIYKQPNAVASDEPFTYFSVYAGSRLTLSDRVHACVATLAYGNPAMLFTPSPRSKLFDRIGLTDIKKWPVSLDPLYLKEEKEAELEFLRNAVRKLK